MSQRMVAQVTCMNCNRHFDTPIEQVLDVGLDRDAKKRLLMGQVNLAVCPHCGTGGHLNLPFIYHDASKELALIFMPMEAGRTDLERQQAIGTLSRAVMNQVSREERKRYLLNPQVFFTYDSLVKRVLEADGMTEEEIEAQLARDQLFGRLLEAETPAQRSALIQENIELVDEQFFQVMAFYAEHLRMAQNPELSQRFSALLEQLYRETPAGREISARVQALEALNAEPTRDKLIDLLAESDDPVTRKMLLMMGMPLVDYGFFSTLTDLIERERDEEKRAHLKGLRQEAMDAREEARRIARDQIRARLELLQDLIASDDLEQSIRERMEEMDQLFYQILNREIHEAEETGNIKRYRQLSEIGNAMQRIAMEGVPPEILLLTMIVQSEEEQDIRRLLEENWEMVTRDLIQLFEQAANDIASRGNKREAERVATALRIARTMVAPGQGASGLEIAKR